MRRAKMCLPPRPQFFLTGTPMQAAQKPLTMAAKLRQVYSPPHTKVGVLWEEAKFLQLSTLLERLTE